MKTKSFEQVLEESSPAVKKAYKKEMKKLKPSIKKKATRQDRIMTIKDLGMIKVNGDKCSICKHPFGNFDAIGIYNGKDCHSDCYPVNPPFFKVTKTTGLPKKELSKRERLAKDNSIYKEKHEQYLKDVATCEHICSGNCRRNGCNCKCGEYCRKDSYNEEIKKSRFADKDFDYNKFPSQRNNKQLLKEIGLQEEIVFDGKNWTKHGKKLSVTPECLRTIEGNRHHNFLGEIEGEPAINCDKWTAMCVVLVLLCVVAYAMHGDYQALQSGLIN